MKIDWEQVRIYIQTGPTDMRKQINGLAVLAEQEIRMDPLSGNLFIFCNRARNRLKILSLLINIINFLPHILLLRMFNIIILGFCSG